MSIPEPGTINIRQIINDDSNKGVPAPVLVSFRILYFCEGVQQPTISNLGEVPGRELTEHEILVREAALDRILGFLTANPKDV